MSTLNAVPDRDLSSVAVSGRAAGFCPGESTGGDWRRQMRHAAGGLEGLAAVTGLAGAEIEAYRGVVDRYPFRVTPYYLSLADLDDPADPVRIQCIPDLREDDGRDEFDEDPFGECARASVPGLVHRFPDRVLVMVTSRCAVRCRHCTRKNTLPAARIEESREFFLPAVDYVRAQRGVREVILSGGDPLLLEPGLLDWLLGTLGRIAHVEVLRIGTRVPVVLPMRLDRDLCRLLAAHRPLWVNTQFNHVRELTPEALAACDGLVRRGMPVSNQSVILRGVNDRTDVMRELCNVLQRNMIRPYYAFRCDPVRGVSHLRLPDSRYRELADELRTSMGGLALPRFVADIPGERGKVPL